MSDTYGCKEILLGEFISFEYLAVRVHCKTKILIITVYQPPKSKCGFLEEFSQLISMVSTNYNCLIWSGDFNIHIDFQTNPDAFNFASLLEAFDLIQHVCGPIHNKGHNLGLVISCQFKDLTLLYSRLWMYLLQITVAFSLIYLPFLYNKMVLK